MGCFIAATTRCGEFPDPSLWSLFSIAAGHFRLASENSQKLQKAPVSKSTSDATHHRACSLPLKMVASNRCYAKLMDNDVIASTLSEKGEGLFYYFAGLFSPQLLLSV